MDETPKKVAIYTRVSTGKQDVENQLVELTNYASSRGYLVYKVYNDEGISGTKASRPALDEMLADAEKGAFNMILCSRLDRLGRSLINVTTLLNQLDTYGVSVDFVKQGICTDKSNPANTLVLNILICCAEFERTLISDRTKSALERRKGEGKHIGRNKEKELTPYLRKKAIEILEADPNISLTQLTAQFKGWSKSTLVRRLTEEGIYPPAGRTVSSPMKKG